MNLFRRSFSVCAVCVATASLGSCSDSVTHPVDGGSIVDSGPDEEADYSPDAEPDESLDLEGDLPADVDAGASPDLDMDAATDLEVDVPPDLQADEPSDSGSQIRPELCAQMCQTTLEVACADQPTMGACVADCLGQVTNCPPQLVEAYYQCIVMNGSKALLCSASAKAIFLRTGYCTKEEADVNACL